MPVKAIPDGFHAVTPYLIVKNAAQALDFYQKAFGAKERFRMPAPGGKIGHGHIWHLSTHKEDLSPQELERRAKEFQQKQK